MVEPNLQNLSSELNLQFMMMEKADQLKYTLKINVKRRGNLCRMFTNESKKLAPIFEKADKTESDNEQLKASQQKLLDARPEMRQLDKEIQNKLRSHQPFDTSLVSFGGHNEGS